MYTSVSFMRSLRVTGLFFATLTCLFTSQAQSNYATPYTFTTLAGVKPGSADGSGDAARFNSPKGVAVDSAGNVYVADYINNTIRKITSSGVVTTLAGLAGSKGSTDGLGGAARFNGPSGVAVDATGNVYVADSSNSLIRKISPAGMVTTLAGSAGIFAFADGTGSAARFNTPQGVAVDAAFNVYVADTFNSTIRKITPVGVVSTLAGSGGNSGSNDGSGAAVRFGFPCGVAVDGAGVLYVADTGNSTIRKITSSGLVTTLAGLSGSADWVDGNVSTARFVSPCGITLDVAGNIYVVDPRSETVRKISIDGMVTTIAGRLGIRGSADGPAGAAEFYDPAGVAADASSNIYVADTTNHTIRKITPTNVVSTFAGNASLGWVDGPISSAKFAPNSIAMDKAGNIYIGEIRDDSCTIRKVTPAGVVTTLAGGAIGAADGTGGAAQFNWPAGLAVDGSGNVYVGDSRNHTIRKITTAGVVSTFAGNPTQPGWVDGTGNTARFNYPSGLSIDAEDNVYVADSGNMAIRKITSAGVVTTLAGNPQSVGSTNGTVDVASFTTPSGVAVDLAGNVYVVEVPNCDVRKISPDGIVTTLAGTLFRYGSSDGIGTAAQFSNPSSIAVDNAGMVYVTDSNNNTIRRITPSGLVTTLAGSAGYYGSDDGTGNAARFYNPIGITVDNTGNVYVVDSVYSLIRKGVLASNVLPPVMSSQVLGDFDGNGKADLVWTNSTTGERSIWFLNGNVMSGGASLGVVPAAWVVSATADFNGDGKADIFLTNTATGDRAMWLMNGSTITTNAFMGTVPTDWVISGTGDFNGDGKADLVWTNTVTGDRAMWLMNGSTVLGGGYLGTVPVEWVISGVGDFNGDGKADLVWSNTLTGERSMWFQNGSTTISGATLNTVPVAWVISGVGDFNGDGKADIFLTNTVSGDRVIWLMNGSTITTNAFMGTVPVEWTISGTGDFNGDKKKDLFWTNTANGDRAMWLLNGATVLGGGYMGTVPVEWKINN